jgi:erythromycin esterase-like protein
MFETLRELREHLDGGAQRPSKIIVWAHNSHLGDARATERADVGEYNLGQLVRQEYPGLTCSIGFTTHGGTATAADHWGGPARQMHVNPALAGSVEHLFHRLDFRQFLLRTKDLPTSDPLRSALLERAIGVIYRPQTERQSHYFRTRLPEQFDAVIHLDHTTALRPLEPYAALDRRDMAETYPTAM